MKKIIPIVIMIFNVLCCNTTYSQYCPPRPLKIILPPYDTFYESIEDKYKSVSKSDTIEITTDQPNCGGDCFESKVKFFYSNDNMLNIITEDSFSVGFAIIKEVSSKDSIKFKAISKKILERKELKEREINFIIKMYEESSIGLRVPQKVDTFVAKIDFDTFIAELIILERLVEESNKNKRKDKSKLIQFFITNRKDSAYGSCDVDINIKEYILNVVLQSE